MPCSQKYPNKSSKGTESREHLFKKVLYMEKEIQTLWSKVGEVSENRIWYKGRGGALKIRKGYSY